jgi:hypothetical protein
VRRQETSEFGHKLPAPKLAPFLKGAAAEAAMKDRATLLVSVFVALLGCSEKTAADARDAGSGYGGSAPTLTVNPVEIDDILYNGDGLH